MQEEIPEDDITKQLREFMNLDEYEIRIRAVDYNTDEEKIMEDLTEQGYEVFPHIITTDNKVCKIHFRKKK